MSNNHQGYVSAIAIGLFEPIFRLIENLQSIDPIEPNEVQTGSQENGYSCGIIVLSVLLLESAINRTRYLREGKVDRHPNSNKYFSDIINDKSLSSHVEEIYTVRDAIVHNHLWTGKVDWTKNKGLSFVSSPKLIEGFGNTRFRKLLDTKSRQTKTLGLNLFPPRIWRKDAYTVFSITFNSLLALEKLDRNYFYISDQYFRFNDRIQKLQEIIHSLDDTV